MLRLDSPPASFDGMAAQLTKPLLRYLQRRVGDSAVAEDLLQETLLRMARNLPGFRGDASPKTWAFTIATRVAADYFRHPDRRAPMVMMEDGPDLPDREAAADDQLLRGEMSACVRQLVDALPEDFRAALILHDLEGLTLEETAGAAGCTVATAKIRIHRARHRLKDALEQQCAFYHDGPSPLRCDRKRLPAAGPPVESGAC